MYCLLFVGYTSTYAGTVIVVSHEPKFLADWLDKVIDMAKMERIDTK
ncbi:hypothetical protein VIBNISOn1_p0188 [Vibrio nigripulchritudo SOn1]|uniref:Uncharacterized protein n=1 Tax=Vibrio nigripulchritudo SOn1 TaxID=1238450 RepID=A0AAV2W009_9VIBR|nr:hypothetical protein [Vibrio nigripulchritudo]CCO50351.1 hypothetical protein VIBNISOn1_p0188 [Vibrio nigripulchritudo SOn1]